VQFGIGSVTYLGATSCAKHHSLLRYTLAPVREGSVHSHEFCNDSLDPVNASPPPASADPAPVPLPTSLRPRRPGRQQLRPAPPRDLDSPSTERRYQDEYYGSMRVKAWSGLHPKTRRIGERYGCERAPVVRGSVILVEVGKHSARPASRSTVALVLRRRGAGLENAHRPCRGSLLSRPMLCHLRVTVPSSAAI